MGGRQHLQAAILTYLAIGATYVAAAEISVQSVSMVGGTTANVIVSGNVTDELTYGVSILVEIIPRAGARGTVQFTPSPPVDVYQIGDPWPEVENFDPFDTDSLAFSATLNGSVDSDGLYLCDQSVTFTGALTGFPVVASVGAAGVWDVVLSTSSGDSSWECLATTRVDGTITVTANPYVPTLSGWGISVMACLLLGVGGAVISKRSQPRGR